MENNPVDETAGSRDVTFSRDLWIEADDFLRAEGPQVHPAVPRPGCRLKGAYLITCTGCVKDESGNVTEMLCRLRPGLPGRRSCRRPEDQGRTIHWVDANNCCDAEVRQYDNLFNDPDPDAAGKDFLACLNPNSLEVLTGCKVEASLKDAKAPASFQFMRLGYFCPDSKDCAPGHLVFNRSVEPEGFLQAGKVIPHSIENPAAMSGSYQTVNRHSRFLTASVPVPGRRSTSSNQPPPPLPSGEVAERSEDGKGDTGGQSPLSHLR